MANTVTRFEDAFAAWLGVRHAFAFWKGRVAMYAILKALGIGEGDEVILPGYTCVVAVNPIKFLGAKPIYVEMGTWFECPLHPGETPMKMYGYYEGMCPVAEKACREVVNLPTHLRVGEATARRSVEFISRIGPVP